MVATASLSSGIDIGEVHLVSSSPAGASIAALLQRVGPLLSLAWAARPGTAFFLTSRVIWWSCAALLGVAVRRVDSTGWSSVKSAGLGRLNERRGFFGPSNGTSRPVCAAAADAYPYRISSAPISTKSAHARPKAYTLTRRGGTGRSFTRRVNHRVTGRRVLD